MEDCHHLKRTTKYDHLQCNTCGAIKTDHGQEWGIAKNSWFRNLEEARFYKEHGRVPERINTPKDHQS